MGCLFLVVFSDRIGHCWCVRGRQMSRRWVIDQEKAPVFRSINPARLRKQKWLPLKHRRWKICHRWQELPGWNSCEYILDTALFFLTLSCKLIFFLFFFVFFPDSWFLSMALFCLLLTPFSICTLSLCFFFGVGQLEYIHLSAPFVAVKNKEVNLTVVLWPSQVGTVTYIWWFGNNSEVLQYLLFQPPCI